VGGVELMNEVELKIMSDNEIMERQSKLIEDQRRLFKATVENFKYDITYLQGCLDVMLAEHQKTRFVCQDSLALVSSHLSNMKEMLNEFEYRMKDHE
jgi:hypothetical protein